MSEEIGGVQYYLNQISQYEREFRKWEGRVDKIVKRYKDDGADKRSGQARFNILWSNMQTLKAATFSRMPQPDVSRRFKDNDPVGRVAALIVERALEFEVDHYRDFRDTLQHSVFDRFLGGRGVAWVRYEPKFVAAAPEVGEQISDEIRVGDDEPTLPDDDGLNAPPQLEADAEEPEEILDYECAPADYVHWKDFGHSVARTWDEVTCVWRKVYLTRQALVDRFGDELAKTVPLDSSPDDRNSRTDPDGVGKRALVYEIWDKERGQACWLSKSLSKFLDQQPDPLQLQEFFPCPQPLYATLSNDSLVPVPDFVLYQDQANELDMLADRIDGLIKALQVRGVYDAATPELARLLTEGENNTLIPVKNWAAFAEKQGLRGAIDLIDIEPIAEALGNAYTAFENVKGQIYEITGISDILRGQSDPAETATAQQLKGQFGSLRLRTYQDEVAEYATAVLRLKAEIICKHFEPESLARMAGVEQFNPADRQYVPPALQMLKNDPMRDFRIAVAADSLLYLDEAQEKQDRMEFLNATSDFIDKIVQAGQAVPQVVPVGVEMLKFGVTGFRVGRTLEGVIDQAADQLNQLAAQQAQQPPKPGPEELSAQAVQQTTQMELQARAQSEQLGQQHEMQLEQLRQQLESQRIAQQNQIEAARAQRDAETRIRLETMKQQHAAALQQQQFAAQQAFDKWKAELDAATRIMVAQIAAASRPDPAAATAAGETVAKDLGVADSADLHIRTLEAIQALREQMTRPRTLIRDENGRVVGVQ